MDLRWLPQPPIRAIDDHEFDRVRVAFRHELDLWRCRGETNDPAAKAWNFRIGSTRMLTHFDRGEFHFGYFFGQGAIGLISITVSDDIGTVEILMTHPGQQGAGSTLIEHAVNAIPGMRRLKLRSSPESRGFYERLGFLRDGHVMELDLESTSAWRRVNGRWRIAAYASTCGYMAI
ncbi:MULTISPECIES: GNAT family N-acetyltransferase [unclassified Chelatococcus]|uniref:GNAT family N-acetyltransferase n=1 Tax=unclassified Chelatococcus TaxID=2638111 RepID=UPI001BCB3AC5|nr:MULTISPECIES: GNAT family N-acetyltransferase [unclassified Chelatococcus]MBS7699404.1 GNAT family N-acetyltransferase [Chelatococcus sp. YT9]MBX3557704.1 GNAT family N-acetyltransferase [Chelatococcus sp.]